MKDTDNLNTLRQRFVEDENLLEPRDENGPASFELGVVIENKRSAFGEAREAFKPGVALLKETVSYSLASFRVVIFSQVKLILAGCGAKDNGQHLGFLIFTPRFKIAKKAFAILGIQRHRLSSFKTLKQ